MPTLEDVARRSGVSTATVSKVLSNTPYFSEATRDKVMRAVRELGYVPNLAARALSSGKSHIIAVVFPYVYDPIFADPLVLRILEGVEAECRQQHYNMLLSTPQLTEAGPDQQYHQLIGSGYLDGVIAFDNVPFTSVLPPVADRGIPVVSMGNHSARYSVRTDDRAGGRLQMEHVLSLGHRRIGIISAAERIHFSVELRSSGWASAAESAGLDFDQLPRIEGDFSVGSGAVCAARLLEQNPDLTALVCLNDRMAMGAIQQARQLGRSVPRDLSIIGYDNISLAGYFDPPLTTVDQRAPMLGQQLARMLFDVLGGQSPDPLVCPVELIVRQSTGRAAA
jgi:DNA-binding LacI/PurR family transcriptional regulator